LFETISTYYKNIFQKCWSLPRKFQHIPTKSKKNIVKQDNSNNSNIFALDDKHTLAGHTQRENIGAIGIKLFSMFLEMFGIIWNFLG
jgi:hypothetical protein